MSLYHEAADMLTAPNNAGGSLKSRIYSNKKLKSPAAQLYALVIEASKWSGVLKEVIERSDILRLERKLTPILSLLLVHDLLLSKRGIALPATHGLRSSVEKHKARLNAELTKARIRRQVGSLQDLRALIESTAPGSSHPRWIRINTLKTQLEDQMDSLFAKYEKVSAIEEVLCPGPPRLYVDIHIPNLVAISPSIDLTKSEAYKSGAIIFQDKASCFPAYLLDPLPEDGDIIDSCAAPGNKTTHLGAILMSHHNHDMDDATATVYACEKNKGRAETLQKMVDKAGAGNFTKVRVGQDFLKLNPFSDLYKNVGALLLDPSCSGSGIIGRDDMPELHLPTLSTQVKTTNKRKREELPESTDVLVDDDGNVEVVTNGEDLGKRLEALSAFQLELLLHAFTFPAARKITYSTCSIHAEENEHVVLQALSSNIAKERGWRILTHDEQVRGMKEWPVRGMLDACARQEEVAEACIRAHKDDSHATMGFFLAGFVRDEQPKSSEPSFLRDKQGRIVRDMMGIPVSTEEVEEAEGYDDDEEEEEEEEWTGFDDDEPLEDAQFHRSNTNSTIETEQRPKQKRSKRAR